MALAALQRGTLRSRLLASDSALPRASSPELGDRTADVSSSGLEDSNQERARSSSSRRSTEQSVLTSSPTQRTATSPGSPVSKPMEREVDRVAAAARLAIVNGKKALKHVGEESLDIPLVAWRAPAKVQERPRAEATGNVAERPRTVATSSTAERTRSDADGFASEVDTQQQLREIFDRCDRNGDGKVNKRELIKALVSNKDIADMLNLPQRIRQEDGSRDQFERIFQGIDVNDDREIHWPEFEAFFAAYAGSRDTGHRSPKVPDFVASWAQLGESNSDAWERDSDQPVSLRTPSLMCFRGFGNASEDASEDLPDEPSVQAVQDVQPQVVEDTLKVDTSAQDAFLPVASSARSSTVVSGSMAITAADLEQEQRALRREERRRARADEMERRAIELEKQHDQRYQQKVLQVRDADEKARNLQDELETMQLQKQERERELREEMVEVRQSMKRVEANAKAKARALRDVRDHTEKSVQAIRLEAKSFFEERDAATRSGRVILSGLRKEISAAQDGRVIATSVSEQLAMQLKSSEQACTNAGRDVNDLQQEVVGLRGILRDVNARASGEGAAGDDVGGAIVARVAEEAAERSAKCEEAAINAELSSAEVKCLALTLEEQTVSRRLEHVETETERLREALRRAPGVVATPNGQVVWELTEERDAARLGLTEMHRSIEQEAAAVVMQAAMDEASNSAAHREDAACAELAHVYEQLRGVVSGKDRDLATLAFVAKEQQASVSNFYDDKSRLVTEELMSHAKSSRDMAVDGHSEVIQQLEAQHQHFVCETEVVLCDLALVHAELSEAHRVEDSLRLAALNDLRGAQSAPVTGTPAVHCSVGAADGASAEMHQTIVQLQKYRATLGSLVASNGVGRGQTADLVAVLHDRVRRLQAELLEAQTSLSESNSKITQDELIVEETSAKALQASPLNTDALAEMSQTLRSSLKMCDDEQQKLSGTLAGLRNDFEAKCQAYTQERSARADRCRALEGTFEQELSAKQADLAGTEAQVQGMNQQIASLVSVMKDTSSKQERMMRKTETDYEVTERMRDRLAALGTADEELHARYKMLSKRAEDAARACASEERTVRAATTELTTLQQSRADADSALRSESASLKTVVANYKAVLASAEARKAALSREELRPGEVAADIASLIKKLADEKAASEALEMDAKNEQEESLVIAKRLAAAKLEASEVRQRHEDEVMAVARLRHELSAQSTFEQPPPALSDRFGRELERMHAEVEVLSQEEAQLSASRSSLTSELTDAHEQRATLQRALHAQEESDAQMRDSQRKASQKFQQDRAAEIAALGAATASEEAKVERANVALEEAMRSIGPLHGELLCTEAAGTTEAEALVMVRADMDVETEVCNAVRVRLSTARSELASLKAQLADRSAGPAASAGNAYRGDDGETDVQRDRIDMDVVEVMAQAIRASAPAGDPASESLAAVGSPQFARQLLEAQAMLEELHHQELLTIREQGRAWRRTLEDEAVEHQAREANLGQLMLTEQWSWAADQERLSQRVRSGEREHVQLENNLLKEISRRESAAADDAGVNMARAESSGSTASPWVAEAAIGLEAAAGGDSSVLARMNNSLRDTHHLLCDQQKQIEEITSERDRLQAHLIAVLERAPLQNSGLAPPASPPVGLASGQMPVARQPPSPPSAELSAQLHALLSQSEAASSPEQS